MTSEKKMSCPKCGGKMSLVAAGWYCMKDNFLIDRSEVLPGDVLRSIDRWETRQV